MENNNTTTTATNPKLGSGGGEEPKANAEHDQGRGGGGGGEEGREEENPSSITSATTTTTNDEAAAPPRQSPSSRRTPFTTLSQVDADLALARTLQEQERAYMMLRMGNSGSDYGSWEAGSYFDDYDDDDDEEEEEDEEEGDGDEDDEEEDDFGDPGVDGDGEEVYNGTDVDEDVFDVHAHMDGGDDGDDTHFRAEVDPAAFDSDEAYARALQDAEERDMAARLLALAGIHDFHTREAEDVEDHGDNSQDTWEEVDPDELSYEELLALGEVVGTESRGLSADTIASLPSINYKTGSTQNGSNDSCVICRVDYEDGETLTLLSCKHSYHSECINNWLKINKVCPVCSAEVSTSGHS